MTSPQPKISRPKPLKPKLPYDKALLDARAEAQRIVADAKAEIQADLDVAISKADAEIAAKSAESAKAISEIRASALENVKVVAKDTTKEIVAAMGGKADAKNRHRRSHSTDERISHAFDPYSRSCRYDRLSRPRGR